tara:strand:+ start:341 stop:1390 length:1050 start_codon:yes stop_codon:yes gene_type:complete
MSEDNGGPGDWEEKHPIASRPFRPSLKQRRENKAALKSKTNAKKPIVKPPSTKIREWMDSLSPEAKTLYSGIGGTKRLDDDVPNFIACEAEDVMQNGNAWIVLGGDRSGNPGTGFQGVGNTHCSAIDLVAGRMGGRATKKDALNRTVYVNPNFTLDAARIYISQKSDIDHYLKLAEGKVGNTSYERASSCVALKADAIRIVGREGIKLVTCTDTENSQTGEVAVNYGIDLIANNDDSDMQPLVKGDNLARCLKSVYESIGDIRKILHSFLVSQKDFNQALMKHTHIAPVVGQTAPDIECVQKGVKTMIDQVVNAEAQIYQQMLKQNFVETSALEDGGAKWICSKYNFTN